MSRNDNRVTFNIMCSPVFKNTRNFLEELYILHAPDEEHEKVFTGIPLVRFKNDKDPLGRSVLPMIRVGGNFCPLSGKRPPCKLCKLMKKCLTLKIERDHLIASPKIQYTLYNEISAANNTVAVLKPRIVLGLTIIKVLKVNLRKKNKFSKRL